MSFSSYGDLKAAIADQLARGDLTDQIPDFIRLFEAAAARKLRIRPMETQATLSTTNGEASLPADFLSWRNVVWAGSKKIVLSYENPAYLTTRFPTEPAGTPERFTIIGGTIKVLPYDDTSDIEFDYYAKNAALDTALNSLYSNHPDVYFFGSLVEAYTFVKDYDQAQIWKARRDEVFNEISTLNFRENGSMQVRIMGPTP
jgi:hypothetical protein